MSEAKESAHVMCPDCGEEIPGPGANVSSCPDHYGGLARPTRRTLEQPTLIDVGPAWEEHWWGMPEFRMGDATPSHRVTVNFLTKEDLAAFADALGVQLSTRSDSMWYPPQRLDEPKEWAYVSE